MPATSATLSTSTTLLNGLVDHRNDHAWRRFCARYTPMLMAYARRVGLSDADGQDAVAETLATFVSAYRDGKYDRTRARLKSWLGGIMVNKVRRVRERRTGVSLDEPGGDGRTRAEPAATETLDDAFEREWQLERLNQALEILRQEADPTTYQAFDLYAVKDWPVTKVASFLGITANAVYIAKTRTLQRLRQIVQNLIDDEG